jgi:hypothetical protein
VTTEPRATSRLHFEILDFIAKHCRAPSHEHLSERLSCDTNRVESLLTELADEHGVVLHPGSTEIWAIHPFSMAPSSFSVRAGSKSWWGCCAWCALGVVSLLDEDCVITTTLGAEDEQAHVWIRDGAIVEDHFVVHFPVPMARAWDNVVYACSVMLLFRSGEEVREWCERRGIAMGDVQPIQKVLELARAWYGDYLSPDWRKRSVDEARALFEGLGLHGPTWELPSSSGRF